MVYIFFTDVMFGTQVPLLKLHRVRDDVQLREPPSENTADDVQLTDPSSENTATGTLVFFILV